MQAAHHLLTGLAGLLPLVAAAAQGQESHTGTHHLHRLQTVLHQLFVVLALQEALCKESRHRHRGHRYAQRVRRMPEQLLEVRFAQLVLKQDTLSQRAHVHLHTVGMDVLGQLKLPKLLAFQHHPVTGSHAILLCTHT